MPTDNNTTPVNPYDCGRESAAEFSRHMDRAGALDYAECGREAGRRDVDEFWTGVADELAVRP